MGDAELIRAVADAGPLIHLAEVAGLSLLQVFGLKLPGITPELAQLHMREPLPLFIIERL